MTPEVVVDALAIPGSARVDRRVPKKLLAEHGSPTAADRRLIEQSVERMDWVGALKPASTGVPAYVDETRSYDEIAVIVASLRSERRLDRLAGLIHRAIPYPVVLVLDVAGKVAISLAQKRRSGAEKEAFVLEGTVLVQPVDGEQPEAKPFFASLDIASIRARDLLALYTGLVERVEALAAASITGTYHLVPDRTSACRRRQALREHRRVLAEVGRLKKAAAREKQISRRVEINSAIKRLEDERAKLVIAIRGGPA